MSDEPEPRPYRQYIDVPHDDRGSCRQMGGKWDTKYKSHYIPPQIDPRPFAQRWRLYLWGTSSRTYLINPRSDGEKNQLRELGAKSDGSTGKWFVLPARMERTRFMAWIPGERVHRPLSDASAEDIAAATGQEYPEDSVSRAGTQITTSARLTNWTEVWQEFVQHFEQREQTIPLLQVMLPRNKIDTYTYFNGTWCNSDEKFFALLVSMKFTDVTSNATLAGEFKNNLIRMLISDNELSAGLEFIPYAEFITSKNVLPDGVYPFRDCLYNLVTGERLEYVDARELTPRTYLTEDIKDSMIAPTDDEWEEWDTEAYRFVRNCFDAIFVDDDMRAEVWTRIGASIMMHSNRAFKQVVVLWGHGHNAKTGFFDMMNVGLGVWAEPLGKAGFIQPNRNADPTKADSQFGQLVDKRFVSAEEPVKTGGVPLISTELLTEWTGSSEKKGRNNFGDFGRTGKATHFFMMATNVPARASGGEDDVRAQQLLAQWETPVTFMSADERTRFEAGEAISGMQPKRGYIHDIADIEPVEVMKSSRRLHRLAVLKYVSQWFHVYLTRVKIDKALNALRQQLPDDFNFEAQLELPEEERVPLNWGNGSEETGEGEEGEGT